MRSLAIALLAIPLLFLDTHSQSLFENAHLTIASTPAGGYVTVDGKFVGTTPMSTIDVIPGRHVVTIRKDGFISFNDTVRVAQGDTVECRVIFDPACELLVVSEPAGAAVYVNDRFRGITPLRLAEMRAGRHAIVVSTQKYIRWTDSITVVVGTPSTVQARLQPVTGSISVDAPGPDHEIAFDGKYVASGPVSMYSHAMGDVLIGARERSTGESVSGHFWVPPEGHLQVAVKFKDPSPEVFLRSLIFPGLGQLLAGHVIKGILYAAGFTVVGILGIEAYSTYQAECKKYDDALATYRSADTRAGALDYHGSVLAAYDDVKGARMKTITFVAIGAGAYLISLADALVFHWTTNRIIEIEGTNAYPGTRTSGPGSRGMQLSVRIPL